MAKIFRKKRRNKPIDPFFSQMGGFRIRKLLAEFNDRKKAIKRTLNNNPERPLTPQEQDEMHVKLKEIDTSVDNIIAIYRGKLDNFLEFKGLTVDILQPMLRREVDVPSLYKFIIDYPELAEFYFTMKGKGLLEKDFPLLSEVIRDFPELTKHFINIEGTDIREADKKGNTPLHYVMESGYEENIKLLLQTEARKDLNSKNKEGETPLQKASYDMQRFLEKGDGEYLQQYVETLNKANIHKDTKPSTSLDLNKIAALSVALSHHYGFKTISEEPKSSHIKPRRDNKRAPKSSIKSGRRYCKRAKKLSI